MMHKPKRTILQAILFVVFTFIFNSCNGQTKTDKLDALLNTYKKYGKFNGSVLVAEKGEVIYKKGFGLANVEWDIPNEPDTKFRLGSITKQFTSMLILQLVAENKLQLNVPVSTYLPDYPKKTGDIVTVHHLLTHTSGIPDYTAFANFRDVQQKAYRPEEIVKLFADSALQFTPGEKFEYSNSGYILLGYIIEKITGQSYEQLLQNKICKPLAMQNTGVENQSTVIKNKAAGYYQNGNTFQNANYINMSVPFAAGAMYSTVEDMFLWNQALYTEKLLPAKYRDMLFEKYIPAFGQGDYGYSWIISNMPVGNTQDQIQTISHSGLINGFSTLITRIPSDKSCIVLLNNNGSAPLEEITSSLIAILYDKPYNLPKRSVAYALSDKIEKEGITSALVYYKEIKDSGNYYLNEYEMNSVGYQLLQSGKTNEAVSVFKLIVEEYPNSFNAYDSYGESLLAMGDKDEAIKNYKRSVELNPENANAMMKVLKDLGVNMDTLITKISVEELKLLEGSYKAETDNNWMIEFKLVNEDLTANDRGYKFKLVPVGKNEFVNPDDGASLIFDTNDENAITLMLFGRFKFKKVV